MKESFLNQQTREQYPIDFVVTWNGVNENQELFRLIEEQATDYLHK